MKAIINGKTFEVKNEKEALKLANGRTVVIQDGIFSRIICSRKAVEELREDSRRAAKDNAKGGK